MSAAITATAPAVAARRITLRDEIAGMLRQIIPGYLTTYGEDDPDLFHVDACDAAQELIEELALRGYDIRRTGA